VSENFVGELVGLFGRDLGLFEEHGEAIGERPTAKIHRARESLNQDRDDEADAQHDRREREDRIDEIQHGSSRS
jgi:hypothetical protein